MKYECIGAYEMVRLAMRNSSRSKYGGTNDVDSDLLRAYENDLFLVSLLYCRVRNRLEIVPICILYCVMVVTGVTRHLNTNYDCGSVYNMLRVTMGSGSKVKLGGD